MANPDMEKAARSRKLLIPLDEVMKGWALKQYPHQVKTMASYLGVFDHMFDGRSFTPLVAMNVDYPDGSSVHCGNFLSPAQTSCEPKVSFHTEDDSLTTLLMVDLDGNILSRNDEILHWMVGNIPNGDLTQGESVCQYLPPCPVKGTGYHRIVFCLMKQTTRYDYEAIHTRHNTRCLVSRSFKTSTFLDNFQLVPQALSFFQATWDMSVSNNFTEILGIKEPVYDLEPFLTPNQRKRSQVREIFAKKYTNM
ncbi:39S ribosomal protein L38, mitochondrial-like [Dendronephthya gigantea]|uniref:39S ribosomal protein L38, mitochondrial-like n=1 Tax=Dendronephthya gigantea TaxID=151771 RepID=UPI00106A7E09|nr:39S ribosomal protein L38, mitochondrial-like [Dendronephthya gigantea]